MQTVQWFFIAGCLAAAFWGAPLPGEEPSGNSAPDFSLEKKLVLDAQTPVSLASLMEQMQADTGVSVHLGEGVLGEVLASTRTVISYAKFIEDVLPENGFFSYQDRSTHRVVITLDLATRVLPLNQNQFRGLVHAAARIVGTSDAADFSEALRVTVLSKKTSSAITIKIPGSEFTLDATRRELEVRDSRQHAQDARGFLRGLEQGGSKVLPLPLVTETLHLEPRNAADLAKAIDRTLFGGIGFEGATNGSEIYLSLNKEAGTLLLHHTAAAIERARRLMRDPNYQTKAALEIKARRFLIASESDRNRYSPDAKLRRTAQVEKMSHVFKDVLYGTGGAEEAAAQGRVIHPDPEEGSISVVDTPGNLSKIEDYLVGHSPSSGARSSDGLIQFVPVRHRTVQDMVLLFR
jgi:hypothetical protein